MTEAGGQLRGLEGLAREDEEAGGKLHPECGSETPGLEAIPPEHITSPMKTRGQGQDRGPNSLA